jgi:ECF transporter S component (folate family)
MKNESRISVRTLTAMALLIAMSIVFSRVLSISTGFVRFNLGSLPVLLAGILFGPWAGFVVGMVADIIGGVLAGYAINPLITLGAASIGLVGLALGDDGKVRALVAALGGGFWTWWFWLGVAGLGLIVPMLLKPWVNRSSGIPAVLAACGASLVGVLMLRFFILYAGQLTVA